MASIPFHLQTYIYSLGVEQERQCDEASAHWQKVHTLP